MEFLLSFPRRHFTGKSVVASGNVSCFLMLNFMKLDYCEKIVGDKNVNHSSPTLSLHSFKGSWSKKTPCSRHLMVDLCTLCKTQDPGNNTPLISTYPYRPNKGVPRPPLPPLGLSYHNFYAFVIKIKNSGPSCSKAD